MRDLGWGSPFLPRKSFRHGVVIFWCTKIGEMIAGPALFVSEDNPPSPAKPQSASSMAYLMNRLFVEQMDKGTSPLRKFADDL